MDHFDNACTKFVNDSIDVGPYDPKKSIAEIHDNFEKELIENPKNLQNKRLYVYVGRSNPVFTPGSFSVSIINIKVPTYVFTYLHYTDR